MPMDPNDIKIGKCYLHRAHASTERIMHMLDIRVDGMGADICYYDIYNMDGTFQMPYNFPLITLADYLVCEYITPKDFKFHSNPVAVVPYNLSGSILNAPLDETEMNRRRHDAMKNIFT